MSVRKRSLRGVKNMNENVLILSANKFDFEEEGTNRQIKGVTVWLLPLNQQDDNINGIKPVKYSLKSDKMNIFDSFQLPAYATMNFTFDFAKSKILPNGFSDVVPFAVGDLA